MYHVSPDEALQFAAPTNWWFSTISYAYLIDSLKLHWNNYTHQIKFMIHPSRIKYVIYKHISDGAFLSSCFFLRLLTYSSCSMVNIEWNNTSNKADLLIGWKQKKNTPVRKTYDSITYIGFSRLNNNAERKHAFSMKVDMHVVIVAYILWVKIERI